MVQCSNSQYFQVITRHISNCVCSLFVFMLCRIYGLEARSALLILTPSNIHILDGFQVVLGPNGEKVIEWSEIVSKSLFTSGRSSPPKAARSSDRKSKTSTVITDSNKWLEKIWYQLLHVDFGYFQIPLKQVCYIIRHMLLLLM